jgi:SAM-dependent methyltransferase
MTWSQLHEWWADEIANDPAYETVVTPLLWEVLEVTPGASYLDLGCGEGRVLRRVVERGGRPIGIELVESFATIAIGTAPTIVARLPSLSFLKGSSVDGAYCVLVLEHLPDEALFFAELARVVRPGGVLALVLNHPAWTAPDSTPITDEDGEVLWRPGRYFDRGASHVQAGPGTVTFHHRSMADLLNAASSAGWSLRVMVERPHHELADQAGIPRLLACQWQLLPFR